MQQKEKPFRSKDFLRFVHERMRSTPCCLCGEREWTELHHFGPDGALAKKPGDLRVARLCRQCHDRNPLKTRALIKNDNWRVLAVFACDALELNEAWIRHINNGREPTTVECSYDEITRWLADDINLIGMSLVERRRWLLMWADKRSAELFNHLTEDYDGEYKD